MTIPARTHVIVGRQPACGCIVSLISYSIADKRWRNETAKDVANLIRDGLVVETITVAQYKAGGYLFGGCSHGDMPVEDMQIGLFQMEAT